MVSNAWLASRMPKENIRDFEKYSWYTDLISDPHCKEVPFQSRTITRNCAIHSLVNRTLATNGTLRACQAFQRYVKITDPKLAAEAPVENGGMQRQALLVASLGSEMDGHPGLAHGGTIGTLFDESLSSAALQVLPRAFMTANTVIRYKKALPTPSAVLIISEVVRWEGRKVWVKGSKEDGNGGVYAEAECLYIMPREESQSKM